MNPPTVVASFHKCKIMWRGGSKPTSRDDLHNHPKTLHLCNRVAHSIGWCECSCGSVTRGIKKR